jgi:UDP-MurNAc hydroxylase
VESRSPIRFLNHASFMVSSSRSVLVCDPWLTGSPFNDGWDLLWPAPAYSDLDGITHIWYSHEHPDHFSTAFLQSIPKERRASITILYQQTRDKRVASWCRKQGFTVVELPLRRRYRVDDEMEILCDAVPIYDSWCRIEVNGLKILNINDCPLEDERELRRIAKLTGNCDVLFTQFSYACWIGRPEDPAERRAVSERLLSRIVTQCRILRPRFVVPFASFIFFSHTENMWMNDSVNAPEAIIRRIEQNSESIPVLLTPNEAWDGISSKDNAPSLSEWMRRYGEITPRHTQGTAIAADQLMSSANEMMTRVYSRNYRFAILLLTRLGIVPAVTFHVHDLNKFFHFSWGQGLREIDAQPDADVSLASESLSFVLRNDFGADSLYVNARFIASEAGKNKLLRAFSVPMLNNTGRFLRLSSIRELADRNFVSLGLKALRVLR